MFEMIPFMTCKPARRDPFKELENFERAFFGPWESAMKTLPFRTDIRETDDAFVLEAELPGFKKEEVEVTLDNETLTIRAERKEEQTENGETGSYIRRERVSGAYARSFDVSGVDTERMTARFADGVLTLTLPKLVHVKPEPKKLVIE